MGHDQDGALAHEYDLLIVVDSTASMGPFLTSLTTSIPQIRAISTLTGCFTRIGVLAYTDYDQHALEDVVKWSGWYGQSEGEPDAELDAFVKRLFPNGGGDAPEATKTGLAKAYTEMREDATTIILLYTDAPPHTLANGSKYGEYYAEEMTQLKKTKQLGEIGANFADWVSAANMLAHRHPQSTKKAQIFTIFTPGGGANDSNYYLYLSTLTGGAFTKLKSYRPADIVQVTVGILLAWMQSEKEDPNAESIDYPGKLQRYMDIKNIKMLKNESDPAAVDFMEIPKSSIQMLPAARQRTPPELATTDLTSARLKSSFPKRASPVGDFTKRYKDDEAYRKMAMKQIRYIIGTDVTSMTTNPIFGSLWRLICNDRQNEERDSILAAFSLAIEKLDQGEQAVKTKQWLEESYDYTAEVLHLIQSVPVEKQYPCVLLDPTLSFAAAPGDGDDDEREDTKLKRDDLLEIGRSCDYKILRRIGRCLTQLTFVSKPETLPSHIAKTNQEELQKIPLALAAAEYGGKFWHILLHLIVPGTMLGARAAALVAALAMRMQVKPLIQSAETELLKWRDRWNNLEVPETFNVNCLSLLLEADRLYNEAHKEDTTSNLSLLSKDDRLLFGKLVSYKMLEMNLATTLTAQLGWTPKKTAVSLGPVTDCRSCNITRSVTIMGPKSKCGICLIDDFASEDVKKAAIASRATESDGIWVECSNTACRSQYCVYNPHALNIRPKCHFCRLAGGHSKKPMTAPFVECCKCLNRIIYPKEYRPAGFQESSFHCYACDAGRKTIVDEDTSANEIKEENGLDWLLQNHQTMKAFSGRSLFRVLNDVGPENFAAIDIFPLTKRQLHLKGKLVQNQDALIASLKAWVSRRHVEQGTCDLCFSSQKKRALRPACGRRGCRQQLDESCLARWYGLNGRGRIVNVAALFCPFCRRAPTAKTLATHVPGIHAVGDLSNAVTNKAWIYAWCRDCGYAKEYMERVCAAGPAPELADWTCDECIDKRKGQPGPKIRNCPGCEVPTQKISGCDHVKCTVCEVHWCFFCGEAKDQGEIYTHMAKEHGGIYGQRQWDEYYGNIEYEADEPEADEYDTDDGY